MVALWCSLISLVQYIYLWKCLLLYIIRASSDVPPEAIDNLWDFWWAILYLLSFTNITHTHTQTHMLPQPRWTLNPDVCRSRWWQPEMVVPTRRHSSDKHLSLRSCIFLCVCACVFSSVAPATIYYMTHMICLLKAGKAVCYFIL